MSKQFTFIRQNKTNFRFFWLRERQSKLFFHILVVSGFYDRIEQNKKGFGRSLLWSYVVDENPQLEIS